MESSRIFINGLPPSISEEEFKKHFSAKWPITDSKLIQKRRIGYVGYKTPEDAKAAVKYFNKTFVRMSKIGVELARAIKDSDLPPSRKQQREVERQAAKDRSEALAAAPPADIPSLKRKRAIADAADPKLQEYLDVMAPVSKTKLWTTKDPLAEEPIPMVAPIDIPEDESDDEYEMVPKKARKDSPKPETAPVVAPVASVLAAAAAPAAATSQPTRHVVEEVITEDVPLVDAAETALPVATGDDDDDWLRSRTNRMLDLVDDPNEAIAGNARIAEVAPVVDTVMADAPAAAETSEEKAVAQAVVENIGTLAGITIHGAAGVPAPAGDDTEEQIKKSGRLFVRNLPYSATEDDLKAHFEKYGALAEVCDIAFFCFLRLPFVFMMNIQIGTAYATASDVNWSEILVDAPCVLKSYQQCSLLRQRYIVVQLLIVSDPSSTRLYWS